MNLWIRAGRIYQGNLLWRPGLLSIEFSTFFRNRISLTFSKTTLKKIKSRLSFSIALEMKSTRTALGLLAVYMLCWGPLGVMYFTDNLCHRCISSNNNLAFERLLVKVISFTSSLFLPLVYCWRTHSFRKEFKKIACIKYFIGCCSCRRR